MTVAWLDEAAPNLEAEIEELSRFSKRAADRLAERAVRTSVQLEQFPLSGRMVPEPGHGQVRR